MKKTLVFLITFILFSLNINSVDAKVSNMGEKFGNADFLMCQYYNATDEAYNKTFNPKYVIIDTNETMETRIFNADETEVKFKTIKGSFQQLYGTIVVNENYKKCSSFLKVLNYKETKSGNTLTIYLLTSTHDLDIINEYITSPWGEEYVSYELQSSKMYDMQYFYSYVDEDNTSDEKFVESIVKDIKRDFIYNDKVEFDDKYGGGSGTENPVIIDEEKVNQCISSHKNDKSCGYVNFIPSAIPFLTKLIMDLIKIVVPIILIIKGLIDLFKAMTASNEQEIAKARSKFFRRLTPALIVFLVILIVQLVFSLITSDNEKNSFLACADCFLNNDCQETSQEKITSYCQNLYSSTNQGGNDNPTQMSSSEKEVRDGIVSFAIAATNKFTDANFVYLTPTCAEDPEPCKSTGKYSRNASGCLEGFYNGKMCVAEKGKKKCSGSDCTYYGTDCNGFISYIYHNAPVTKLNSSEYKFFAPNSSTGKWDILSAASSYFTRYSSTIRVNNSNRDTALQQIKSIVKEGDALGRYCHSNGGFAANHIGIYVGNGEVVDNNGSISKRSLSNFVKKTTTENGKTVVYDDCEITILQLNASKFVSSSSPTNTNPGNVSEIVKKYYDKGFTKISIPSSEKCRQKEYETCNENQEEEGYIKVIDGVFYFPYDTAINGQPEGKGSGTEGLNKTFQKRLDKFFAAARAAGHDISVKTGQGDGYRSIATQNYFCCCANEVNCKNYKGPIPVTNPASNKTCTGRGTCNSNGTIKASTPGTSPHGWGFAADLNLYKIGSTTKSAEAVKWAHEHAEEYGLAFPVSSEDWHIEPLYVCDINGISSKYGGCKRQKTF